MKRFLLLIVMFVAINANAIELGGCYKLLPNKEMTGDPMFSGFYFCSNTVTSPTTGRNLNGIAFVVEGKPEDSEEVQLGVLTCGAADYIKFEQNLNVTTVQLAESDIRFDFEQRGFSDEGMLISEQLGGEYKRATPEATAKLKKVIGDNHCKIHEYASTTSKVVIKQKNLKFDFSKSGLDPKDLKATAILKCEYEVGFGLYFSSKESCGQTELDLEINQKGEVKIPQMLTYAGLATGEMDHYEFEFKIVDQTDNRIVWIGANMKNALKNFNSFKQTLNVTRIFGGKIKLTYQGQNFFGSHLTQIDEAYVSAGPFISYQAETNYGFYIYDLLGWSTAHGNNYGYTPDAKKLKSMTELEVPDAYLVTAQPIEELQFQYYALYSHPVAGGAKVEWMTDRYYAPMSQMVILQLPTLELKPKTK